MDRIDIQIDVPRVDYSEFRKETNEESSAIIRDRVVNARRIQYKRYKNFGDRGRSNAEASPKAMEEFCKLDEGSHQILERMMVKFGYSGRAHNRILKVARTIADLEGVEAIGKAHLMEAVQYRSRDRSSGQVQERKVTHIGKQYSLKVSAIKFPSYQES